MALMARRIGQKALVPVTARPGLIDDGAVKSGTGDEARL
jgi:hypothetical protein